MNESLVSNISASQLQKNTEVYECNHCQNKFTTKPGLKLHIESKHEGVKFACMQCEYQATRQSALTRHIQSKHEGEQ